MHLYRCQLFGERVRNPQGVRAAATATVDAAAAVADDAVDLVAAAALL